MADDAAAPDGELSEETAEDDSTEADKPARRATVSRPTIGVGRATATKTKSTAEQSTPMAPTKPRPPKPRMSHVRLATILGLVAVVALAGLCGWLGFRAYQSHKAADERKLFLQVGRQGALNLTTIDFEHADADVQRILDSSTGTFYDDFQARAQPFVEVVKQAKSKSVGTIAEAGVESESERRGRGARRGDRQDVQCRCARTGAARLADADHGAEGRRRRQGVQRGVRAVTEHKHESEETVENTAAAIEADTDLRHEPTEAERRSTPPADEHRNRRGSRSLGAC